MFDKMGDDKVCSEAEPYGTQLVSHPSEPARCSCQTKSLIAFYEPSGRVHRG